VSKPHWKLETVLWQLGYHLVAGVDEAGRGALAGPVVAAAVVLPKKIWPFRDSKLISPQQREMMALLIKEKALACGVGVASAAEVDELNVLRATHIAAYRALKQLPLHVTALVTDFLKLSAYPYLAVPKGDSRSFQIAAASIVAKTTRDQLMLSYAKDFPEYGFQQHKGYGSAQHLKALERYGPCEIHRNSYGPVAHRRLFQS
jgi:ribonuclease HII